MPVTHERVGPMFLLPTFRRRRAPSLDDACTVQRVLTAALARAEVAIAVFVGLGAIGCGDTGDAQTASPADRPTTTVAVEGTRTTSDRQRNRDQRPSPSTQATAPRSTTQTAPGGATFTPAPLPEETRKTEPAKCAQRGGRTIPPPPGVTARYVDRSVVAVTYAPGALPAECRAVEIRMLLDVHGDTTGPFPTDLPVKGTEPTTRRIKIPPVFGRPDLLTASVTSKSGRVSEAARIRIAGS